MRSRGFGAAGAAVLLAALLGGCGGSKSPTTSATVTTTPVTSTSASLPAGCTSVPLPPAQSSPHLKAPKTLLAPGKSYDVTFETNCGSFTIKLDQAQSPHAAASFAALAKEGFFDKTIFHRIVTGFVIQGGDPTQSGGGGPGYETVDTPPANATYSLGVVAMAKTSTEPRGTAGSQFFVVSSPEAASQFTPDYAIVGKVTKGLDVVERIGGLGSADEQGTPTAVVEITKATVTES